MYIDIRGILTASGAANKHHVMGTAFLPRRCCAFEDKPKFVALSEKLSEATEVLKKSQ